MAAHHWDPSDGILQGHEKLEDWIKQHSDPMYKRLGASQRAYEDWRRTGKYDYDSDEQEFISGIDEHLTRATDDLHKVTEYLLTKP